MSEIVIEFTFYLMLFFIARAMVFSSKTNYRKKGLGKKYPKGNSKELEKFFLEVKKSHKKVLGKKRKKIIFKETLSTVLFIIILFLFVSLDINFELFALIAFFLMFYIICGPLEVSKENDLKNYVDYFYRNVLAKLVNLFSQEYVYEIIKRRLPNVDEIKNGEEKRVFNPQEDKFEKEFRNANFINTNLRFGVKDYFVTNYGGSEIKIINMHLSTSRRDRRDIESSWDYKGLFTILTMDMFVPYEIRITNVRKNNDIKNVVDFGNKEFHKRFNVECESEKQVMKIFRDEVMNDFIKIYDELGFSFTIVIKENKIYIKADIGHIFSPELYKSPLRKESLWVSYSVIKFILSINKNLKEALYVYL